MHPDMKQVILMRAIPGSGKSTMAKQLISKAQQEGKSGIICSADDYFYELGKGSYAFDRTKIAEAHKYCFKKFMDAVNQGIDLIIVDNTNLSAWEMSPYKQLGETMGYKVGINEVVADQGEAFKRQQHGVPEFAHKSMSEGFNKEFVPPWWDKTRYQSKTDESGQPVFEEVPPPEPPPPSPQLGLPFDKEKSEKAASVNQLTKVAAMLAIKYRM